MLLLFLEKSFIERYLYWFGMVVIQGGVYGSFLILVRGMDEIL